MDNEASSYVCKLITNTLQATYQKVALHCHQPNAAEKAIQTVKYHYIPGLASTDAHFLKHSWDDLLPLTEFTLNMLWPMEMNFKTLAYIYLSGKHNYNSITLVPPKWKVLCFDDPTEHQAWALHGTEDFHLAPAQDNYHCYKCSIPTTRCTCITNTIVFYLPNTYLCVTPPTPEETLVEAAKQLGTALMEVAQKNPLYNTLTNFKGSINWKIFVVTSQVESTPIWPSMHCYPTQAKAINTLCTDSSFPLMPLPAYLVDALDATDPDCVSNAYINTIICPTTGKKEEYRHLISDPSTCPTRDNGMYDELGQLAQGNKKNNIKKPNTTFVHLNTIPNDRKVAYIRIVVDIHPQKGCLNMGVTP